MRFNGGATTIEPHEAKKDEMIKRSYTKRNILAVTQCFSKRISFVQRCLIISSLFSGLSHEIGSLLVSPLQGSVFHCHRHDDPVVMKDLYWRREELCELLLQ